VGAGISLGTSLSILRSFYALVVMNVTGAPAISKRKRKITPRLQKYGGRRSKIDTGTSQSV
jgi:hypothetical protein